MSDPVVDRIDLATYDKQEWRLRSCAFLLDSQLFDRKLKKLSKGYIEMFGLSGIEMYKLLQPYLKTPKDFIAAEHEAQIAYLTRLRLLQLPEHERFDAPLGDFYNIALAAANQGRVGAFSLDGTQIVGNQTWWRSYGNHIREIISAALKHTPEVLLIFNSTLDHRNSGARSERLLQHTIELCEYLGRWGATPRRFLGRGSHLAKLADDPSYSLGEGSRHRYIGAYDIYKSAERYLRMATLRLRFRKDFMLVDHETD